MIRFARALTRAGFAFAIALAFTQVTSTPAQAACEEERAAFEAATAAFIENEAQRLQICGDLRVCKADVPIAKKECKFNARNEKFHCMKGCDSLRGGDKRQCKRECRQSKKLDKLGCKKLRLQKTVDCRKENPECITVRGEAIKLAVAEIFATEAYFSCARKSGDEDAAAAEEAAEEAGNSGDDG